MQLRIYLVVFTMLLAAFVVMPVMAEGEDTNTPGEKAAVAAEKAAKTAAPLPPLPSVEEMMPDPLPAPEAVMVKVNDSEVTFGQIEAELSRAPEHQRASYRPRVLDMLVQQLIEDEFIAARQLQVDKEAYEKRMAELEEKYQEILANLARDVKKARVNIRRSMIIEEYIAGKCTDEKITEYMAANPHFFDGSKVKVSHILLESKSLDSSEDQKATGAKLAGIREQILNGDISFEDAAMANSTCPSKEKGGDLGEITPGGQMDPIFTINTFKTPLGEISEPFRTTFGWHIVKVTEANLGDGKAITTKIRGRDTTPVELAKMTLEAIAKNELLLFGFEGCNVQNFNLLPKPAPRRPAPRPAPRPRPAPKAAPKAPAEK